jgi:hypothetical protein
MSRHKGITSDATLDRKFPYHAVIAYSRCTEKAYEPAHGRANELGCAFRRVFINRFYPDQYLAFRFVTPEAAETMAREFDGEVYSTLDRGKGSGWEKWRKKIKRKKAVA